MRVKNSCRFEPFFKLEYFDERLMVWKVIQKPFSTIEKAKSQIKLNKKFRIMKVTEKGVEIYNQ